MDRLRRNVVAATLTSAAFMLLGVLLNLVGNKSYGWLSFSGGLIIMLTLVVDQAVGRARGR